MQLFPDLAIHVDNTNAAISLQKENHSHPIKDEGFHWQAVLLKCNDKIDKNTHGRFPGVIAALVSCSSYIIHTYTYIHTQNIFLYIHTYMFLHPVHHIDTGLLIPV